MADILVEIRHGVKSFQQGRVQSRVLTDIDFTIERGEFVAIEGRSGSGKSTLLSIIGLLDHLCSGEHWLLGQAVSGLSSYLLSVIRNRHIGWVFQNFNLISQMTALENVMLPLRYQKDLSQRQRQQLATQMLADVGLDDKVASYPEELSGGQQQRVAIARALVTKPSLILADEPTGNLDSQSASLVMDLLHRLHQQGSTVLMVTHDPQLAASAQRRLYLADGCFVAQHDQQMQRVV